jgi:hypothetical protein
MFARTDTRHAYEKIPIRLCRQDLLTLDRKMENSSLD